MVVIVVEGGDEDEGATFGREGEGGADVTTGGGGEGGTDVTTGGGGEGGTDVTTGGGGEGGTDVTTGGEGEGDADVTTGGGASRGALTGEDMASCKRGEGMGIWGKTWIKRSARTCQTKEE